jgi:hypothetical protein
VRDYELNFSLREAVWHDAPATRSENDACGYGLSPKRNPVSTKSHHSLPELIRYS